VITFCVRRQQHKSRCKCKRIRVPISMMNRAGNREAKHLVNLSDPYSQRLLEQHSVERAEDLMMFTYARPCRACKNFVRPFDNTSHTHTRTHTHTHTHRHMHTYTYVHARAHTHTHMNYCDTCTHTNTLIMHTRYISRSPVMSQRLSALLVLPFQTHCLFHITVQGFGSQRGHERQHDPCPTDAL